ncbi:hypothetical protein [Pectobacterium brasiliense]|nr:hypothetical protein [Pectobacterium brasiliense]
MILSTSESVGAWLTGLKSGASIDSPADKRSQFLQHGMARRDSLV